MPDDAAHPAGKRGDSLVSDDLAGACLHLLALENPPDWVNVGSGQEVTIRELAGLVKETVGFAGELRFDPTKPDGTPRKLLDVRLLNSSGWKATTPLREGLAAAYDEFKQMSAAAAVRD